MFKPIVDIRARIYDMAHEAATPDAMTYVDRTLASATAIGTKLPRYAAGLAGTSAPPSTLVLRRHRRRRHPGRRRDGRRDVVAVRRPGRAERGRPAVRREHPQPRQRAVREDPFHVSANTDPKGDRSKRPQDQDPDMLLHVVKETDAGIIVRGAKYETAAAYANQAFTKPTIANWGNAQLSDYAVGFICDLGAPNLKFICRTGFAGRAPAEDYPLSNRFDEVDTLADFDDVLIPWENVLFYRHTRAATFIRATLHRYSAFPFVQRNPPAGRLDDRRRAVQCAADRAGAASRRCRRSSRAGLLPRGINAHLTAAIALAERSPGGLADAEPVAADNRAGAGAARNCTTMMHIARELCGGQICVTPDAASVRAIRKLAPWLEKYYTINDELDRRGSPQAAGLRPRSVELRLRRAPADVPAVRPVAALCASVAAVYRNFDFDGPLGLVKAAAGLSDTGRRPSRMTAHPNPAVQYPRHVSGAKPG